MFQYVIRMLQSANQFRLVSRMLKIMIWGVGKISLNLLNHVLLFYCLQHLILNCSIRKIYIDKVYVRDTANVYINCIYFNISCRTDMSRFQHFREKFTLTKHRIPNAKEKNHPTLNTIVCRIKHPT